MARPNYGTIKGGATEQETSVLASALGLHGEYQAQPQEEFKDTLEGTQTDAIAANTASVFDLSKLASLVNDANTTELLKMMERMLPGYASMLSKGLRTASSLMAGELPADAQRNIADWAAGRGISSGTTGSQFADSRELWKYGISTLEGQQRGLNQFLDISARSPKAPLYDFTSMFITPSQLFNSRLTAYQTNLPVKLYNEWARNQPKNWERAAGQFLDWVATEGTSVLNMYLGGAMGGGGAGGMMGGMGGGGGGGDASEAGSRWSSPPSAGALGYSQGAGVGTGEGGGMPYYEGQAGQFQGLGEPEYFGSGENWPQFYQSPYFG